MDVANSLMLFALAIGAFGTGHIIADFDLAPIPMLKHRSIWTHGPLLPVFLMWAWRSDAPTMPLAVIVACMSAGFAIHIIADMFPRAWRGSALINLNPLGGALNGVLSFLILAFSAGLSVYAALPAVNYLIEVLL